ncbi:hypothetical protein PsAD26_01868 [Pseudovibrio sp. Ad26]|nr:hypothetical protein PsAD26_01868 [Pseudovibrio sp. Ad26]
MKDVYAMETHLPTPSHVLQMDIHENVKLRLSKGVPLAEAPLFPKPRRPIDGTSYCSIRMLFRIYQDFLGSTPLISPITGELIKGNPRRVRHTLLTMLVMVGCAAEVIATYAGHASPQS